MHDAAYEWVQRHVRPFGSVLDIGGRNINGTVRDLFSSAREYLALDILPGDGVDIVANAATWVPDRAFDVVVCCEVFEHTWEWPGICATAYRALTPKGFFIATMAGPGRAPHSGVDGLFRLLPEDYYANVDPDDLREVLVEVGFCDIDVDHTGLDVRCVAVKGDES